MINPKLPLPVLSTCVDVPASPSLMLPFPRLLVSASPNPTPSSCHALTPFSLGHIALSPTNPLSPSLDSFIVLSRLHYSFSVLYSSFNPGLEPILLLATSFRWPHPSLASPSFPFLPLCLSSIYPLPLSCCCLFSILSPGPKPPSANPGPSLSAPKQAPSLQSHPKTPCLASNSPHSPQPLYLSWSALRKRGRIWRKLLVRSSLGCDFVRLMELFNLRLRKPCWGGL